MVRGILALGLVFSAARRRFARPVGGVLEALQGVPLFKVFKTSANNGCGKCGKVCELSTRSEEADCANCGDCLGACPAGAVGFGRKPREVGKGAD